LTVSVQALLMLRFHKHYHEKPASELGRKLSVYNNYKNKIKVWNTFVDSQLPEITEDDFSIIPRVLPDSYMSTIEQSAFLVTKFALKLLSLPESEIRAIVPVGPIRDHLLDELKVVKYRHKRITGSFRFDMAIVGPPKKGNSPLLLEINEIGFDGLARSTFFQKTFLDLMPDLKRRFRSLDTAAAEVENMGRLGRRIARMQYDSYNWDEQYLLKTAKELNLDLRLICPSQFRLPVDQSEYPFLERELISYKGERAWVGKDWPADAINMSFAYSLKDYQDEHPFYSRLVRSQTPQYGPFLTGLVAAKTVLILLDDPVLRRRFLGSSKKLENSILSAHQLSSATAAECLEDPHDWVLKHTDGCGGEQVYMNRALEKQLLKIQKNRRHEWVLQRKTDLNLIDINGILSKPKKAIADLGVFVQYDWAKGDFLKFKVGGLMARATNKSLKVNVSGGGSQVAVLLDRAT
jgi:hypothetical protein